jgi:hypothetical protein
VPAASQQPPPTSSGGHLKYVALGLLFLGGTVGLWFAVRPSRTPPPPAKPPAEVARVNPMAEQELDLEPEAPDAGKPPPEPEAVKRPGRRAGAEWECSGDLPGASKVVNDNRAQIRSCYERRLKVNNILQGDLRLKLKIGSSGKVVASAVSGSLKDEQVFSCVRSLAQGWSFPVPQGGNCAVVQVPFHFSPKP